MSPKMIAPTTHEEDEQNRLIERADGFYWQHKLTDKLRGPFPTMAEAMEEAEYQEEVDFMDSASLHEAEDDIGIADWIDPDTGQPAEGSIPHFND